jgi:tetratricopeptide (TPR) repeat protein
VLVVASTGLATFVAGVAGLLQSNLYVAVPTLAVAAILGSWTLNHQLKVPPTPIVSPPTAPTELAGAGALTVPRQLPAAVAHFAGREEELAALTGLLRDRAHTGGTVVISAIGGTAGVGKTALAVYWAHQVADRFPDGQLYVNLRGFDPAGTALEPAEAVRRFLDALAVPTERIPADPDAGAALYRSQLAGRRMLIVLDNARDTAQVRPLLPGAPTCLVLVTSRNQLSGLIAADGAHPITLDPLSATEARELLVRRLGADRVAAELVAVEETIARCARLPLALAIVAARAATDRLIPLGALAGELRNTHDRLNTLATADDPHTNMRAVLSWSYHALTPAAARLFRLLGLHPGPDISTAAAASLAAVSLPQVRALLAELIRANMLVEPTPGRYSFHDLLRAYATEQTHRLDADAQRRHATHRMLDHYLHTAHAADVLLEPNRDPITLSLVQPGVTPESFADHQHARDWYTAEHAVLLAAVDHATGAGFDTHTWRLAWTLANYLDRQGRWHDEVSTQHAALAAAFRLADPIVQARAHRTLARAYTKLGLLDDAHAQLRNALDLYRRAGDPAGQAHTHHNLALVCERQARHRQALDHARQALDLSRAAGHQDAHAIALNQVGWYHAQLGDHQQALAYCQQALPLLQELNDRDGQAATWDSLGYAHHHLGHHTQAITCYQHALDLYGNLGDRYNEAVTVTHLGDTHHTAGDIEAARDAWRRAMAILDQLDHPDAETVRAKLHDLDRTRHA